MTCLRYDEIFSDHLVPQSLSLKVKNLLKICQHLPMLWERIECLVFLDSRCISPV